MCESKPGLRCESHLNSQLKKVDTDLKEAIGTAYTKWIAQNPENPTGFSVSQLDSKTKSMLSDLEQKRIEVLQHKKLTKTGLDQAKIAVRKAEEAGDSLLASALSDELERNLGIVEQRKTVSDKLKEIDRAHFGDENAPVNKKAAAKAELEVAQIKLKSLEDDTDMVTELNKKLKSVKTRSNALKSKKASYRATISDQLDSGEYKNPLGSARRDIHDDKVASFTEMYESTVKSEAKLKIKEQVYQKALDNATSSRSRRAPVSQYSGFSRFGGCGGGC